jgi:hypothetical protein
VKYSIATPNGLGEREDIAVQVAEVKLARAVERIVQVNHDLDPLAQLLV